MATWGGAFELYTPDPSPSWREDWRPTITRCPTELRPGESYTLTGTQFNGLSQANSNIRYLVYGTSQNATGYPLVQLRRVGSGRTHYCRTDQNSTMGVGPSTATVTTRFTVPTIETGPYDLRVIANGIPSDWCRTGVPPGGRDTIYDRVRALAWVHLIGSLADGPLWVLDDRTGEVIPVPPMDPAAKQARILLQQLDATFAAFVALGKEVTKRQGQYADELGVVKSRIPDG